MAKSRHATVDLTSAELMQIKSTIAEALDALSHWQRVQFAWEELHRERFEATREKNLSPYQLYLERERETSTLPDTPEKSHSAISKIIEIDGMLKAKEGALFKSLKIPEKTKEVQPKEKEKESTMSRFTGGMQRDVSPKELDRAEVPDFVLDMRLKEAEAKAAKLEQERNPKPYVLETKDRTRYETFGNLKDAAEAYASMEPMSGKMLKGAGGGMLAEHRFDESGWPGYDSIATKEVSNAVRQAAYDKEYENEEKEVEHAPVSRDPAWEAQLKRAAEIGDQDRIRDAARFPELAAQWDGYLKSHPEIERTPAERVEYATFTAQLGREAKERDAGRPELGSALDEKMAKEALDLYRERQSGSFENAYYGLGGDGPNVRSMGEHTVPEGPSAEYHKALGGSDEHEMGM